MPVHDNDPVRSALSPAADCCGSQASRRTCRSARPPRSRCVARVPGARAEAQARYVDESRRQPRYRRERKVPRGKRKAASAVRERVRRLRGEHHRAKRASRLTPSPHPSPRPGRRLAGRSDFHVSRPTLCGVRPPAPHRRQHPSTPAPQHPSTPAPQHPSTPAPQHRPVPPRLAFPPRTPALRYASPSLASHTASRDAPSRHSPNAPPRVIHNFCGKPCGKSAGWPGRAARGLACL